MQYCKKITSFISLVCVVALMLSMVVVPVAAADGNSVTATTSTSVKQGSSGTTYVYIDSTEGIAALDVTVHYDPAKVKITGVYNSVSCTLYDSVTNADNIQFSYILDGKGSASKTRLFYFYYQVLSSAEVGDAWFDITIGEAYDNSLNELPVSGSRCKFTVTETVTNKTCSVSSSSSATTAVGKEFTLSYRLSTYQIASGTAVITYDPELFEVVSVTNGAFLTNKVVDINTELNGEVYISFVGTAYTTKYDFVTVTFKTIKNVTEASKITLKTPELLDKELNSISCSGYTTNANIVFDSTYIGDAPVMALDGSFSYENMQIVLTVSLEAESHLGAGDFVIGFDPELVTYNSCTKGFTPSFFNINDKETAEGKLKFHIISLSDIVTEETVLTVVFDVKRPYGSETVDFTLDGTGLTNSLVESIMLNFEDDSVWLEYMVTFCNPDGTVLESKLYRHGDTVTPPGALRPADDRFTYTFTGWDKEIVPCTTDAVYTAGYTVSGFTSNYIRLTEDTFVEAELTEDLYIDLNGHDLSGTIVTGGYKVYGMDSTTDSYTCENIGYFNCVDENGNAIAPVTHFKSDITGATKRYMAIENENGYSFHRFYLAVTHMNIRPTVTGVGYKAVFYGDPMVAAQLDAENAFGFTLTLEGGKTISGGKAAADFTSGKVLTLRIEHFDAVNFGENDLSAAVWLKLQDGTVITTDVVTSSIRSILEYVNSNYTSFTQTQLTQLKSMIEANPVMQQWSVENLK